MTQKSNRSPAEEIQAMRKALTTEILALPDTRRKKKASPAPIRRSSDKASSNAGTNSGSERFPSPSEFENGATFLGGAQQETRREVPREVRREVERDSSPSSGASRPSSSNGPGTGPSSRPSAGPVPRTAAAPERSFAGSGPRFGGGARPPSNRAPRADSFNSGGPRSNSSQFGERFAPRFDSSSRSNRASGPTIRERYGAPSPNYQSNSSGNSENYDDSSGQEPSSYVTRPQATGHLASRPTARPASKTLGPRAPKLPPAPLLDDVPLRLSKLMTIRGLCSRREADDLIAQGLVKVDGVVVDQLGTKCLPTATVELHPQAKEDLEGLVTILLNKPVGYVSSQPELGYDPAVILITQDSQVAQAGDPVLLKKHFEGLAPAGRLDIDSQGLLIFTQNGQMAKKLIGENSDVEKEYLVRVEGDLSEEGLALLNHGLELDGVTLRPALVEWLNEDQLRFVLKEGRKRQIRRMCELVGLHVVGLKRVRIGNIRLGRLPEGQWRFLEPGESF